MSAITESAKGETCAIRGPSCIGGTETTVWAHSPFQCHGRGMGIKSKNLWGCYSCHSCHDELDGRRGNLTKLDKYVMFTRANSESIARLIEKGLVIVND